ncbi:MAG: aminotransferase class IV [candidate division Zixibacteria bacterium]|nr:aminotransferase class IV [candidate division Zixibacteria bacterium]
MRNNNILISIDGEIVDDQHATISVLDGGLLFGYGVFETILAVENKPIWVNEHLSRMARARKAIGIDRLFSDKEIKAFLRDIVCAHPSPLNRVRVFQTVGEGAMWSAPRKDAGGKFKPGRLVMIVRELPRSYLDSGIPVIANIAQAGTGPSWLDRHKTLSWLSRTAVPRVNQKRNSRTATLLSYTESGITEFTNSSLLVRRGRKVLIAPRGMILPSIALEKIRKRLSMSAECWQVTEKTIYLSDLKSADEIIGANSLNLAFSLSELRLPDNNGSVKFESTELTDELNLSLWPKSLRQFFL